MWLSIAMAYAAGRCNDLHCLHASTWPATLLLCCRNVLENGTGWEPLGKAEKQDVVLSPGWKEGPEKGQSQHDYAVLITKQALGRKLGWLNPGVPKPQGFSASAASCSSNGATTTAAGGGGGGGVRGDPSADGSWADAADMLQGAAQQYPLLQVAGYPDNRLNGSMWHGSCGMFDWQLQGKYMWHGCSSRGGNSGSPLWVAVANASDTVAPVAAALANGSSSSGRRGSSLGAVAADTVSQGIDFTQGRRLKAGGAAAGMNPHNLLFNKLPASEMGSRAAKSLRRLKQASAGADAAGPSHAAVVGMHVAGLRLSRSGHEGKQAVVDMREILTLQQQRQQQRGLQGQLAASSDPAAASVWASYCHKDGIDNQWFSMPGLLGNETLANVSLSPVVAGARNLASGLFGEDSSNMLGLYEGPRVYPGAIAPDEDGGTGSSSGSSNSKGEPLLDLKWVWQPVAVPFTDEMTRWLRDVVDSHECSEG